MNSKISVVIPTLNRKESLKQLLDALQREDYPHDDLEVIVVDDGSCDGTREWLLSYSPDFKLITIMHGKNKGSAVSRNDGIRAASNGIILFLDDDLVPQKGILSQHSKHHNEKKIAVIGDIQYREAFTTRWISRYLSTRGVHKTSPGEKIPFKCFWTSNASIRKEHLMNGSLFDERFKGAGGEDIEIAYRLDRGGITFLYEKDAVCYHKPVSLSELLEKQESFVKKALPILLKKNDIFNRIFKLDLLANPFIKFSMNPVMYYSIRTLSSLLLFLYIPPIFIDYLLFYRRTH